MTVSKTAEDHPSLIQSFLNWLENRHIAHQSLDDLQHCDAHDLQRMAGEFGIAPGDLLDLAARGPEAGSLMLRMLAERGLTEDMVRAAAPGVLQDMEIICTRCQVKGRCEHNLNAGHGGEFGDAFCPNAETMHALKV